MREEKRVYNVDGIVRPRSEERRINQAIALTLGTEAGETVINYLRSITIEQVCGPHATDAELRHREGMRHVFGILTARLRHGMQGEPKE